MKKLNYILTLFFSLILLPCVQGQEQLAFPGAEGFGRYAKGVRGVSAPEVYHVTNLNDSGAGSLRDAVSKPGRIVVFDVSGVIKINSRIVFSGNSYIAGQTAPGDGIIIYGDGVSFSGANNLIVRYLRVYMGKNGSAGKDAAGIANGSNMIFDHMSVAWGLDENFSINGDNKGTPLADITIQNSILGQGLQTHSCGGLIQTDGGVSLIGNLYIDNKTRNPKVKGLNQFVNNVVYNWGSGGAYLMGGDSEGISHAHIEGNYFISGPESGSRTAFSNGNANFNVFHKNNKIDYNRDGELNGSDAVDKDFPSATIKSSLNGLGNTKAIPELSSILSPDNAFQQVISSVGASLPARTAVDEFMINELISFGAKGLLIAHERENGIYNNVGIVSNGSKPLDSDNDGIPDWWEDANGLNKNDASDATKKANNGYLNIENYINSITAPVADYIRCPSNLVISEQQVNSITFVWQNNRSDCDNIVVQRSTDGKTFSDIATIAGNATSYQNNGLEEETTYYYRLISTKKGLDDSTPSEIIEISTLGKAKVPQSSINPSPENGGTSRFYTEVPFSWENSTGTWAGDVTFAIHVGTSPDNLTKIASDLVEKSFTYTITNPKKKQTYYWRVDATNSLGTTQSAVWSFTSGEYSFVSSLVDIGRDYDGKTKIDASSGILLSTNSKSYYVSTGTTDEMKYSLSGGSMNNSSNNVYDESGSVVCFYLQNDADYVEGTLTKNSSKMNIAHIKVNGTSANVYDPAIGAILFCDEYPFNTSKITGFEEVEFAICRKGNSGMTVTVPVGSKSFRLYRKVTVSPVDEDYYSIGGSYETVGSSNNIRLAYIGSTLELVSFDGEGGEVSADNTISNATINGKKAKVSKSAGTVEADFRYGTSLGDWQITFVLGSSKATADFESGASHNFTNGPLTIKVTAENGDIKAYTVSVNIPDKITIGMLTANGKKEAYDDLFVSAFDEYEIKYLTAATTAPEDIADFYDKYNLIVVHPNVAGNNATLGKTRELVGVQPILSMKVFCYNDGRWGWSASGSNPGNAGIGEISANVATALQNHHIFSGVTFEGENLTFYKEPTNAQNGIQYATAFGGTNWTAELENANHVLATFGKGTQIHEVNLNNAAKYLMIGLSQEGSPSSFELFNSNTIAILKNTAAYLLNPDAYYDYKTNQAITSIEKPTGSCNLSFREGRIINPGKEIVRIFNLSGISLLTSSNESIELSGLPSGIFIAVAQKGVLKFVK